jgi:hypothetical protein
MYACVRRTSVLSTVFTETGGAGALIWFLMATSPSAPYWFWAVDLANLRSLCVESGTDVACLTSTESAPRWFFWFPIPPLVTWRESFWDVAPVWAAQDSEKQQKP